MARTKASLTQRTWGFGEVGCEFQEREEFREQSAKKIRNMRITNAEILCDRPGSCFECEAPGAFKFKEARPVKDEPLGFVLIEGGFKKLDKETGVEQVVLGAPWTADDVRKMYCEDLGQQLIVGNQTVRPHVIDIQDCSVSEYEFKKNSDGSTSQPYENFHPGVTIQPSDTSGTVNVVASEPIWTADYVGLIIRCGGQEILVTSIVSPTEIIGDFLQDGNPTCEFEVSDATQFQVDDAVRGNTSFAEGTVVSVDIATNMLTVLKDDTVNVFSDGEELIGPNINIAEPPTVTSEPETVSPAAKTDWDEQVFSDFRGWPGSAACHQGRLIFVDICQLPTAYAMSAAGDFSCFGVGSGDGDAIFDYVGKNTNERLRFAISAEDLIVLSDQNAYYFGTRGGNPISPTENNNPIRFSSQGAADVCPAIMDDSIAYVSESGNRIMGAALAGDAQRYWTTVHLSEYAPDLIRNPQALGSSEGDTDHPEQYLFVANDDGTLAVMRHQRAPFEQKMGWVLWENESVDFIYADTMCGKIRAIAEKDGVRAMLRFEDDAYVDWGIEYQSGDEIPEGVDIWGDRYWGQKPNCYLPGGPFKAGCSFYKCVDLWQGEIEQTNRKGFVCQRNGRTSIVTKDSASYVYNGQRKPHYQSGDDVSAPPVLRTEKHRFSNLGRFDHAEHLIEKPEPGPLCILAVSMEVQG